MNKATKTGPARPLLVLVLVILVVASTVPLTTRAQSASTGDILWPQNQVQTTQDLPQVAGTAYGNGTEPLVIGAYDLVGISVERTDATTSRVNIDEENRQAQEFTQSHRSVTGTGNTSLFVRASELRPTIEVTPTTPAGEHPKGGQLIQAVGPPGSFNTSGDGIQERAFSIAAKLDLPNASDGVSVEWRETDGPSRLFLYHSAVLRACIGGGSGSCNRTAGFMLDCSSCEAITRTVDPEPADEVEASYGDDPGIGDGYNRAEFIFADGTLIGFRVALHVDLNPSALVDPGLAAERAARFLEDEGYQTSELPSSGGLHFELAGGHLSLDRARYRWTGFSAVDPSGPTEEKFGVAVLQDAQDGRIIRADLGPQGVHECPTEGCLDDGTETLFDPNATPGPSLLVALLAFSVALTLSLHGGRRR